MRKLLLIGIILAGWVIEGYSSDRSSIHSQHPTPGLSEENTSSSLSNDPKSTQQNLIGLYLDPQGDDVYQVGDVEYPYLCTVYLMVKNFACLGEVGGWECGLQFDESVTCSEVRYRGRGFNQADLPFFCVKAKDFMLVENCMVLAEIDLIFSRSGGVFLGPGREGTAPALLCVKSGGGFDLVGLSTEFGGEGVPALSVGDMAKPPQPNPEAGRLDVDIGATELIILKSRFSRFRDHEGVQQGFDRESRQWVDLVRKKRGERLSPEESKKYQALTTLSGSGRILPRKKREDTAASEPSSVTKDSRSGSRPNRKTLRTWKIHWNTYAAGWRDADNDSLQVLPNDLVALELIDLETNTLLMGRVALSPPSSDPEGEPMVVSMVLDNRFTAMQFEKQTTLASDLGDLLHLRLIIRPSNDMFNTAVSPAKSEYVELDEELFIAGQLRINTPCNDWLFPDPAEADGCDGYITFKRLGKHGYQAYLDFTLNNGCFADSLLSLRVDEDGDGKEDYVCELNSAGNLGGK